MPVSDLERTINDEWAYTSAGLEAVAKETIFTIRAAGWADGGHNPPIPSRCFTKTGRSLWRYVTKDGRFAMVRDPAYGHVGSHPPNRYFVRLACLDRTP